MAATLQATESPAGDQRRQERCRQIVDAATQLFAELGYADCEMDRLAAKLKIAKGTLYLYFKSKEELFYACVDHAMIELQAAVTAAAAQVEDPLQKIPAAIRSYLEFFDAHPQYVELFIQERANFRDRQRPSYFKHRDANRGPWRELYRGLIESGRLRGDLPVERLLDAIGNVMYGTMFTNRFAGRSISIDDQFDSLMKIIFRGILAENNCQ